MVVVVPSLLAEAEVVISIVLLKRALLGVYEWTWELHFQLSNVRLLVWVVFALAALSVPQFSLYKREEKAGEQKEKGRQLFILCTVF